MFTVIQGGLVRVFNGGVAVIATVLLAGGCSPSMPELGARIDAMSGESIRTAVSALSFGECRTLPRTAVGMVPGQVTRLQICAIDGGENAGGSSTPANGVWVARIVNKGGLPDKRWELKPGAYESWIVAYGPAPVKYAIVEISTTSPSDPPRMIVMDGVYHHCGHPPKSPRARASFGTCADNPGTAADPPDASQSAMRRGLNQLRSSLLPKTLAAQGAGRLVGPAWIDCGGDCCTTDAQ